MANNRGLREADKLKKDEFYTQLIDIEKELKHYKSHFKDKIVYCNCDNPYESNFFRYFVINFNGFGLRKLVATCYSNTHGKAYKMVIKKVLDGKTKIDDLLQHKENELSVLKENGDFRSAECIELLKEADIVVTNPPFSLFREFVAQLVEYDKKFIIVGNVNAITYKDFFPLIKDNKVWMGISIHSGDREFRVPDDYPLESVGYRIDNGKKYIRVKGVRWWTNLDYKTRHVPLELFKKYNSKDYSKYDNYDAINVNKTKEIPIDYEGVMGVPITFLDKYCPEQFKLLGIMNTGEENEGIRYKDTPHGRPTINGKELYLRLLIKKIK